MDAPKAVVLSKIPSSLSIPFFIGYTWLTNRPTLSLTREEGFWHLSSKNERNGYWFPRRPSIFAAEKVSSGYAASMRTKYMKDGFADIEAGDTVVDVGAYVGAFTNAALQDGAERVIIIEPSATNAECCVKNVISESKTKIHQIAAWNSDTTLELEIGKDPSDNSLIGIDRGRSINIRPVTARRLDSILNESPDFLKIDAEGSEPEVIEGLGELKPDKISIDVSAERQDKSPEPVIHEMLNSEYKIKTRNDVLFAKR